MDTLGSLTDSKTIRKVRCPALPMLTNILCMRHNALEAVRAHQHAGAFWPQLITYHQLP